MAIGQSSCGTAPDRRSRGTQSSHDSSHPGNDRATALPNHATFFSAQNTPRHWARLQLNARSNLRPNNHHPVPEFVSVSSPCSSIRQRVPSSAVSAFDHQWLCHNRNSKQLVKLATVILMQIAVKIRKLTQNIDMTSNVSNIMAICVLVSGSTHLFALTHSFQFKRQNEKHREKITTETLFVRVVKLQRHPPQRGFHTSCKKQSGENSCLIEQLKILDPIPIEETYSYITDDEN